MRWFSESGALAAELDDLSSIFRTHVTTGKN